jgi:hypothetical protein
MDLLHDPKVIGNMCRLLAQDSVFFELKEADARNYALTAVAIALGGDGPNFTPDSPGVQRLAKTIKDLNGRDGGKFGALLASLPEIRPVLGPLLNRLAADKSEEWRMYGPAEFVKELFFNADASLLKALAPPRPADSPLRNALVSVAVVPEKENAFVDRFENYLNGPDRTATSGLSHYKPVERRSWLEQYKRAEPWMFLDWWE